MNESKFNVLLYSDESQPAFFAVVYSSIILMNMPNMHLFIVQLRESNDGSTKTKNDRINSWLGSPTSDWMKGVIGESNSAAKTRYHEIITKTNDILAKREADVSHQVIYCNPSIPDTVDALLEYANKKSIELIVVGSRELSTLKLLIFGSLAHSIQHQSLIPVLLVKKLPKDFPESYSLQPTLQVVR